MDQISLIQLRRKHKKRRVVVKRKIRTRTILAVVAFSLVLLVPILSQSGIALSSLLLAVCTLLLFSGIIVGLPIYLLAKIRLWLVIRKYAAEDGKLAQSKRVGAQRSKNSFWRGLESIFLVSAWAFFLYLMQPFITAFIWWQGYKLLEENLFTVDVIEGVLDKVDAGVYFGMIIFIINFSWSEWNHWYYGKANRQQAKPQVSDMNQVTETPPATVASGENR